LELISKKKLNLHGIIIVQNIILQDIIQFAYMIFESCIVDANRLVDSV